ncbi:hypothetical protein V6Z12_A08G049400 [Gossypium hirsutum]
MIRHLIKINRMRIWHPLIESEVDSFQTQFRNKRHRFVADATSFHHDPNQIVGNQH